MVGVVAFRLLEPPRPRGGMVECADGLGVGAVGRRVDEEVKRRCPAVRYNRTQATSARVQQVEVE